MTNPFSFRGRLGRLPYALWSLPVFFSQYLFAWLMLKARGAPFVADEWFLALPLRSLAQLPESMLVVALAYFLLVGWMLAALAFRRAVDANISEWIAAAAMAPIVQVGVILLLCVVPPDFIRWPARPPDQDSESPSGWALAAQGMVAGTVLTVVAVAVSTLVFGVYGTGLFWLTPFVIGGITAYIANRKGDVGHGRTVNIVVGATALGGIALIAFAIEGLICIILASPLGFGAGVIGGYFGRAIAVWTRRPAKQALSGLALLPIVFALETAQPATRFDTTETIAVNAPAEAVWAALLRMDAIEGPLPLPFRLGLAYPVRGEILGEGLGAVRHGEFSTGTAIERVTEWVPHEKLAFVVESDVPALRELSPYEHVHAPHVIGYFRTTYTSFALKPRADGGTDIVEHTSHEVRLDPILYWLPMARFIVHINNMRVLTHIKRQAEGRLGSSAQ